jgi:hypothetical protein
MDQTVFADLRQLLCASCDQVSEPIFYKGEGPYIMTMYEDYDDVCFCFNEMNDVESFLADPGKKPAVFADDDFLLNIAEKMNLTKILDERGLATYHLFRHRFVLDALVCREAIRELHKHSPELVKGILLIDSRGNISPGETVVPGPFVRLKLAK